MFVNDKVDEILIESQSDILFYVTRIIRLRPNKYSSTNDWDER